MQNFMKLEIEDREEKLASELCQRHVGGRQV